MDERTEGDDRAELVPTSVVWRMQNEWAPGDYGQDDDDLREDVEDPITAPVTLQYCHTHRHAYLYDGHHRAFDALHKKQAYVPVKVKVGIDHPDPRWSKGCDLTDAQAGRAMPVPGAAYDPREGWVQGERCYLRPSEIGLPTKG